MAVLNDFRKEFKHILIDEDLTTYSAAEKTGKAQSQIAIFTTRKEIVSPLFAEIYDKLGYDIRIEYIKRGS